MSELTGSPLDDFDGFKRFVHVSECEVKAEIHHGRFRRLFRLLQSHEVAMNSLYDHRLWRRRRRGSVSRLRQVDLKYEQFIDMLIYAYYADLWLAASLSG